MLFLVPLKVQNALMKVFVESGPAELLSVKFYWAKIYFERLCFVKRLCLKLCLKTLKKEIHGPKYLSFLLLESQTKVKVFRSCTPFFTL